MFFIECWLYLYTALIIRTLFIQHWSVQSILKHLNRKKPAILPPSILNCYFRWLHENRAKLSGTKIQQDCRKLQAAYPTNPVIFWYNIRG